MLIWVYAVILIFCLTFLYASWRGAPWVPMRADDVVRAMRLAKIKEGEIFFDLGCGDGRSLLAAARAGAKAEGFEISLLPYFLAKIKIFFCKGKNKPKIYFRDLWRADLSRANTIFVFLTPRVMDRLREKMEKELKSGVKIICYVWPMPGWNPVETENIPGRFKIYRYIKN